MPLRGYGTFKHLGEAHQLYISYDTWIALDGQGSQILLQM